MASADDVFAAMKVALGSLPGKVPVWIPGDLPTQSGAYPNIKLRLASETKQSMGRNSIGFTTLLTVRLEGEVNEPAPTDDDVAVSTVVTQLTALKTLAERAIINSYPLFGIVQQLASVTTQFTYTAQATRLAGIQCDYAFELFESAEDFAPLSTEELTELVTQLTTFPGVGLTVALPQ